MKYDRRTNYYCTPRNSSSSPFREPSLLSSNTPFPSPTVLLLVPVSISLSLSLDARHSRDVSQSKRFCNASMIYCTCRDLTSGSFERGGGPFFSPVLLFSDLIRRGHGKARRLIRGRADLPRNLYPPFHDPTSFIPLDLARIRSSFNPFIRGGKVEVRLILSGDWAGV